MNANTNSQFDWFSFLQRALIAAMLCVTFVTRAAAADVNDTFAVVVTSLKGDVRVTMGGQTRSVQKGSVLELPATIQTGPQSAIDLRQDRTTVAIAADTRVEIPASAAGTAIEGVIQTTGSAFYNVGKREAKKLRVETPYLVAVIKGTQFNVVVQGEGATVSLFEGRLEVRAPDGSDIVDLNAGEMAIRQRSDKTIRVLRMDSGESVRTPHGNDASARAGATAPRTDSASNPQTPGMPGRGENDRGTTSGGSPGVATGAVGINSVGVNTDATLESGSALKTSTALNVSAPLASANVETSLSAAPTGTSVDVGASIGAQVIDANASVGADVGSAGASLDVNANLGAGAVDTSLNAGVDVSGDGASLDASVAVDAGPASVDVGADAGVDVGAGTVDLGVDAGVDTGVAAVDVGADAGVDVGAGTVDLGVDAGVDTGVAAVDLGTDAGVDVGAGTVDLGVDVGADTGLAAVDLGADAGADLGTGTIDAGTDTSLDLGVADVEADTGVAVDTGGVSADLDLGVGGLDVGLDVGLGAGGLDVDLGAAANPTPDPEPPAGGLLGVIKRRLGRD